MPEKSKKPRRVYGYKVVRKVTDGLVSIWATGDLQTYYFPKATAVCHPESKKHGFGLFFYTRLRMAKAAWGGVEGYEIWKVSMLKEDVMRMPKSKLVFALDSSEYGNSETYIKVNSYEKEGFRMARKLKMVKKVS